MKRENLIEEIAKVIYEKGGIPREHYEALVGEPMKEWGSWSLEEYNLDNQLVEHERDEYRYQARAVIEFLESRNALQGVYLKNKKEIK